MFLYVKKSAEKKPIIKSIQLLDVQMKTCLNKKSLQTDKMSQSINRFYHHIIIILFNFCCLLFRKNTTKCVDFDGALDDFPRAGYVEDT